MTRAYPVEWARHINVTKELLLFYTTLAALHHMLSSSRLAMSTARPLTLPSDDGFLLTQMSDLGEELEGDNEFESYSYTVYNNNTYK